MQSTACGAVRTHAIAPWYTATQSTTHLHVSQRTADGTVAHIPTLQPAALYLVVHLHAPKRTAGGAARTQITTLPYAALHLVEDPHAPEAHSCWRRHGMHIPHHMTMRFTASGKAHTRACSTLLMAPCTHEYHIMYLPFCYSSSVSKQLTWLAGA